jgi:hypothetical protein
MMVKQHLKADWRIIGCVLLALAAAPVAAQPASTSQEAPSLQGMTSHLGPYVALGATLQLNDAVPTSTLAEVLDREGIRASAAEGSVH